MDISIDYPPVIIVLLRQPKRSVSDERRDDPFWEFGSFGCTGCHRKNLMNPKRSSELEGARFAFVQGGDLGFRLVHVTPPITTHALGKICEVRWSPAEMPLAYAEAPLVVDNQNRSDIPELADIAKYANRPTPVSRFASKFRTRRGPLAGVDGTEVLSVYRAYRDRGAQVATVYHAAMPYPPPLIVSDRQARYDCLRQGAECR